MKKRILNLVLVFSLIAGMIPLYSIPADAIEACGSTDLYNMSQTLLSQDPGAHDGISFSTWSDTTSLPAVEGNWELTNDITLSSSWTVPSGTTNLCLNGHIINLNGNNNITVNDGSVLNLYDCGSTDGHYFTYRKGDYWSYIEVPTDQQKAGAITIDAITDSTESDTIVVLSGGAVTGGTSNNGDVAIDGGTFTINSGSIVGHNSTQTGFHGGGVRVNGNGTFNMNGGLIAGCRVSSNGGAVGCSSGCKMFMTGGTIAHSSAGVDGGGVFNAGVFKMSGGIIKYCRLTTTNRYGGGVFCTGTFEMSGGAISYNDGDNGGGISVYGSVGNATMSGGIISYNHSRWGGGVELKEGGDFTLKGSGQICSNISGDVGGGVYASNSGSVFTMDVDNYTDGAAVTDNTAVSSGSQIRSYAGAAILKGFCTVDNGSGDLSGVTNNITKSHITFDKQGGTGGSDSIDQVEFNSDMPAITLPTRTGFAFDGYFDAETDGTQYYNADGTSAKTWDKIVADVTLYAHWTPVALSGTATITGAAMFGETLTATLTDSNNTGTLSYQWKRGDEDIVSASAVNYIPVAEDIGKTITVVITSDVQTGSVISSPTAVVTKAAAPAAPTGLTAVKPTVYGAADGKITGTTAEMEYSTSAAFTSATACSADAMTGLPAGTYYVRLKGTETHETGLYAEVTVPEGDKIQVPIPTAITGLIYTGTELTGVAAGTGYEISSNTAISAGTYTATAELAYSYIWSDGTTTAKEISWTISKAALTATASSHEVLFGDAVPEYTITYAGWVNGESIDTVTPVVQPALTCAYTSASAVGSYGVIFATAPAFANYEVTTINGVVSVTRPSHHHVSTNQDDNTEASEYVNPFVDVSEKDYFYEAVKWAAENGITNGRDASHFDPCGITSRAQMVTFLWRAAGKPEPKAAETPFIDLVTNEYYYKAVLWAYENGITNGTTTETFEPDTRLSRAHAVTLLWRYAEMPAVDFAMNMSDVASGKYYTEAVRWALSKKITEGTTTSTFSPNDACLRGQLITFLYRECVK